MSKKRKRELHEKIKLNQEHHQGNSDKITGDDFKRLKHSDDYKAKIIRDSERFQDKVLEKTSKRDATIQETPLEKRKSFQSPKVKEAIEVKDVDGNTQVIQPQETKERFVEDRLSNKIDIKKKDKSKALQDFMQENLSEEIVDDDGFNKENIVDQVNEDYGKLTEHVPIANTQIQSHRQVEVIELIQADETVSKPIKSSKRKKKTFAKPQEKEYLKAEEPSLSQEEIEKKKDFQRKVAERIRENEGIILSQETVYDPLSQDLDNDGIIDRYDNDFRDSDYFESTYDVDGLEKDKAFEKKAKPKQKQLLKKKNYSDKLFTRKKDSLPENTEVASTTSNGKEAVKDRQKKNMINTEQKSKLKKEIGKVSVLGGVAKGSETIRDYLSQGSNENQGVEAGEKVADASSKLIHGVKNYNGKRKHQKSYAFSQNDFKARQKKSKLEFKRQVNDLKKTEKYKKSSAMKKLQKKKQMKSAIYKQNETRVVDRLKQGILNTITSAKQVIIRRAKGAVLIIIAILILGTFVINFSSMSATGMLNGVNSVLTTTYLSNENTLSDVNQQFSSMEQELQDEIDSVEENYPGYDEYIINMGGTIGHETHELLAYITSRCGQIEDVSQVESILEDLFDQMYELTYDTEIEIRYRTEYYTYTDGDGNTQTGSYEVPYEYKKLIVTLTKREMDEVVREVFASYPDNILHYEALLASQGNMGDFFGSGSGDLSEIVNNPNFGNPGIAFDDATVQQLFQEAEKHIGKRYVFGANGPSNFDCSSFVCWSFTKSGVANMPRTTAWGIYKNYCTPICPSVAQAGDIIFFKNTYNSGTPISHVGIYAGNGMMLHAGDPIQYTSINTKYWQDHFYGFGRPN